MADIIIENINCKHCDVQIDISEALENSPVTRSFVKVCNCEPVHRTCREAHKKFNHDTKCGQCNTIFSDMVNVCRYCYDTNDTTSIKICSCGMVHTKCRKNKMKTNHDNNCYKCKEPFTDLIDKCHYCMLAIGEHDHIKICDCQPVHKTCRAFMEKEGRDYFYCERCRKECTDTIDIGLKREIKFLSIYYLMLLVCAISLILIFAVFSGNMEGTVASWSIFGAIALALIACSCRLIYIMNRRRTINIILRQTNYLKQINEVLSI